MMDGAGLSVADALALSKETGNCNDGMFGGNGAWMIFFLFFLLAWGGGWNNGGYAYGAGMQGALTRADLCSEQNAQNTLNGIRGIQNGVCDATFSLNNTVTNGFAALNNTLTGQFAGIDNAVCTLGYQNAQLINGIDKSIMQGNNTTQMSMMQGFNGVQAGQASIGNQIADCCCKTQQNIKDSITQGVMNTSALQNQIQQVGNDNEKETMRTRYAMEQQNCATLQAINSLGDRIIDYMANSERQALRDENFTLKLAASQERQNNLLINELRPCAKPAYITCNPYESVYGYSRGGCGCNQGCGC